MRLAALVIFLLVNSVSRAQQDDYYGPYRFEPRTTQVIFSDTALIRAEPSGAVRDTLYAFEPVSVTRALPLLHTVGRKTAPWYEVRYKRHGQEAAGYLWGGGLAIASATRDGVTFAFGVLSYPQPPTTGEDAWPARVAANTCAIKARDARSSRVQQCLYNISPESASFLDTSRDEDGKVNFPRFSAASSLPPGARTLVHFYMSGEACGIPSYQITAAWDGTQLVRMPLLEDNVDAGVYSYSEAYVYPQQRGSAPGLLTIRCTTDAYDGEDAHSQGKGKRTVTSRRYRWDGTAHRFVAVK